MLALCDPSEQWNGLVDYECLNLIMQQFLHMYFVATLMESDLVSILSHYPQNP